MPGGLFRFLQLANREGTKSSAKEGTTEKERINVAIVYVPRAPT